MSIQVRRNPSAFNKEDMVNIPLKVVRKPSQKSNVVFSSAILSRIIIVSYPWFVLIL
jgi:hypothetical protein